MKETRINTYQSVLRKNFLDEQLSGNPFTYAEWLERELISVMEETDRLDQLDIWNV